MDDVLSPRIPPLLPLLSSLRAHTRRHHRPKRVRTGTNQSQNKHLSFFDLSDFLRVNVRGQLKALSWPRSCWRARLQILISVSVYSAASIFSRLSYIHQEKCKCPFFVLTNAPCAFWHNDGRLSRIQPKRVLMCFSSQVFRIFLFLITLSANHCETTGSEAELCAAV